MCKSARIILSVNEEDNKFTEKLLEQVQNNIAISKTTDGQKLLDISELPYIYTDEGDRYFGVKGVEVFVAREALNNK